MSSHFSPNKKYIIDNIYNYFLSDDIHNLIHEKKYYELGLFYQFVNYCPALIKKYYLLAIEQKNSDAMNNLGYQYYSEQKYDKAIKYYSMAFEHKNTTVYNNIGMFYFDVEKNYDKAVEYYKLAADNNIPEAFYNLALYYHAIKKDINTAIKYYIEAIIYNIPNAKEHIKIITTPLERYILFNQNQIIFDEEQDRQINIFINRLNSKKLDDCIICMEYYTNIPLECGHYICVDCYPKILKTTKCPVCRTVIYS
jgi:tetratricopeptide (TPR) repeat protein